MARATGKAEKPKSAKSRSDQQNIRRKPPPGRPFEKGKSGNPGGRPKEVAEVKELARKHTKEAIERLVFWMQSDNAKASVSACNALLDRAWGKAPQAITGDGGGALEIRFVD